MTKLESYMIVYETEIQYTSQELAELNARLDEGEYENLAQRTEWCERQRYLYDKISFLNEAKKKMEL